MLAAKRQAKIIEYLRRERFGSLSAIAALVNASTSTVRRDLDVLGARGHLVRTHGGAMLCDNEVTTVETAPEISRQIARQAKARIGEWVAQQIQAGQSVIFDSGSTTLAAARALRARGIAIQAVTNDVRIAAELARAPQIAVQMPGGQVRPGSTTLLGGVCANALAGLRVDIALIGAHAVSADGASETSIEHAEIKQTLLAAAARRMLLVDNSKMPARALCRFASLDAFSDLVTDEDPPADIHRVLAANDVALAIAR